MWQEGHGHNHKDQNCCHHCSAAPYVFPPVGHTVLHQRAVLTVLDRCEGMTSRSIGKPWADLPTSQRRGLCRLSTYAQHDDRTCLSIVSEGRGSEREKSISANSHLCSVVSSALSQGQQNTLRVWCPPNEHTKRVLLRRQSQTFGS